LPGSSCGKSRGRGRFQACRGSVEYHSVLACCPLPPANVSDPSRAELEALLVELLGGVSELRNLIAAQRDEIARLKGLEDRPSLTPSGMENATKFK
jgi:uncharacterized small protein (DUF1192 family)